MGLPKWNGTRLLTSKFCSYSPQRIGTLSDHRARSKDPECRGPVRRSPQRGEKVLCGARHFTRPPSTFLEANREQFRWSNWRWAYRGSSTFDGRRTRLTIGLRRIFDLLATLAGLVLSASRVELYSPHSN